MMELLKYASVAIVGLLAIVLGYKAYAYVGAWRLPVAFIATVGFAVLFGAFISAGWAVVIGIVSVAVLLGYCID